MLGSVEDIRAQYEGVVGLLTPLAPPFSENIEFKDGEVGGVKYRVYNPKNQGDKKLPVGVWTHGGGWMVGTTLTQPLKSSQD